MGFWEKKARQELAQIDKATATYEEYVKDPAIAANAHKVLIHLRRDRAAWQETLRSQSRGDR